MAIFIITKAYAADAIDSSDTGWEEYLTVEKVILEPPTWCGPNGGLVIKTFDEKDRQGGVLYIDVPAKKSTWEFTAWATKDPYFHFPFCSFDGQTVFMFKVKLGLYLADGGYASNLEGGLVPDGMWTYDFKSEETRKFTGDGFPRKMRWPASPAERIYAVVAENKSDLAWAKMELPGWKVLTFPQDKSDLLDGMWSSDGSYLLLRTAIHGKKRSIIIYDKNGKLLLSKELDGLLVPNGPAAAPEGVYLYDNKGRLYRLNPYTGDVKDLGTELNFQNAPVYLSFTRKGDIAYYKGGELWITSLGGKGVKITDDGAFQSFSPDGKYLAYVRKNKTANSNYDLVILKRKIAQEQILPVNVVFGPSPGPRNEEYEDYYFHHFHKGQDFSAMAGTPIPVADDGKVVVVTEHKVDGRYFDLGKYVVVEHHNSKGQVVGYTVYGHMSETEAKAGDKIKKGDTIGFVGNTGDAFTDHLHFEVRPIDPNAPISWYRAEPVNPSKFEGFK